MVKVAIFSPHPRISGVVAYSHHTRTGFRSAGHDADVVTFTLSGRMSKNAAVESIATPHGDRSGWGWSTLGADRVGKWSEAADVLAEYDFVLVEEPRCAPLDKKQMRKLGGGEITLGRERVMTDHLAFEELPMYVQALAQYTSGRIAFVMHDPGYGPKLAPFLRHFVRYVKPDLLVTHRDGAAASGAWAGLEGVPELRLEHLPYAPVADWGYAEPEDFRVATTGRYVNNKGQPTVMLAAALRYAPPGQYVALGASPLGAGPNHTFLTYEGLTTRYGFVGHRDGQDVTRGWPWWCATNDGRVAEYAGPYQDPVEALRGFAAHACLTDPAFSGRGSVEYVTLEAMDAGVPAILVREEALPVEGPPLGFYVPEREGAKLANAELAAVDEARDATARDVGRALEKVRAWLEGEEGQPAPRDVVAGNREVLRERHSPGRYAAAVLEALP